MNRNLNRVYEARIRHANRYDGLTWCTAREDWGRILEDNLDVIGAGCPPVDLGAVTCTVCLCRIVAYGREAARRLRRLGEQ